MAGTAVSSRVRRRRCIRKVVVRVCIFVVLGVVVNVAVAWGIKLSHGTWQEIWATTSQRNSRVLTDDEQRWYRANEYKIETILELLSRGGLYKRQAPNVEEYPRTIGWRATEFVENNQGPRSVVKNFLPNGPPGDWIDTGATTASVAHRIECGWPLRSMKIEQWADQPIAGWELPFTIKQKKYTVPVDVMAMGFAINTVFYGLILWLLFAAPFVLRKWRRNQRGLCPKCAYPVGESDICTECGGTVR